MSSHRVVALTDGAVDAGKREIHFKFVVTDRSPMPFIIEYGPATQFIGALGRMFLALQEVVQSEKTGTVAIAAEQLAMVNVHKDRWKGDIILQIITPAGIPYNFAMPSDVASDIANRLKAESKKPHQQAGFA